MTGPLPCLASVSVCPRTPQAFWERFNARLTADDDVTEHLEGVLVTATGEHRLVDWHIAVQRGPRGEVIGTLASGEDITERREAEEQLRRDRRHLEILRRLAQDVASHDDARQAVVDRIAELCDAGFVLIAEPDEDGGFLELTRATSPALVGQRVALDGETSAAARAFKTREPVYSNDVKSGIVNPRLAAMTGAASGVFQPVMLDGEPAAVLCVGWRDRVGELEPRHAELVAIGADEAAVALQRLRGLRRLEQAALTDALTGIRNRRAFDQELPLTIARARRSEEPLALAMMDLNEFKALNDSEGHDAGDRLLRETAAAWTTELRVTDVLARIGGDEFAAILPSCGADHLTMVADRLRTSIPHAAGCGVGIALWDGIEDLHALMQRADGALYEDKAMRGGRRLANPQRLAAVKATGLLDGSANAELDDVTRITRWLLDVPVALVSLLGADRQTFGSACGLEGRAAEDGGIPLSHSFCQYAVASGRPLIIDDARTHALVSANPAIGDLGIVAYAGIPLADARGNVLGVLCAIDHGARSWSEHDVATLQRLADRAQQELVRAAADPLARR